MGKTRFGLEPAPHLGQCKFTPLTLSLCPSLSCITYIFKWNDLCCCCYCNKNDMYSVFHKSDFSGNQGNHQNFEKSLVPHKLGLI